MKYFIVISIGSLALFIGCSTISPTQEIFEGPLKHVKVKKVVDEDDRLKDLWSVQSIGISNKKILEKEDAILMVPDTLSNNKDVEIWLSSDRVGSKNTSIKLNNEIDWNFTDLSTGIQGFKISVERIAKEAKKAQVNLLPYGIINIKSKFTFSEKRQIEYKKDDGTKAMKDTFEIVLDPIDYKFRFDKPFSWWNGMITPPVLYKIVSGDLAEWTLKEFTPSLGYNFFQFNFNSDIFPYLSTDILLVTTKLQEEGTYSMSGGICLDLSGYFQIGVILTGVKPISGRLIVGLGVVDIVNKATNIVK
ncbi:MAG: hypothetical protein EPN82_02480 [Bacteroidetes bacterium]|nr:MAG: hypothetical protein EPN82_02480 [Bacteroidota bacterium]